MQKSNQNPNNVISLDFNSPAESLPPQNLECEEAVIGGIMLDPSALARVAPLLPVEAFYVSSYARIYQAALELHEKGKPTDLLSISNHLASKGQLEGVGGRNALVVIFDRSVSAVNIDAIAGIIVEKHKRRQIIKAAGEILRLGYQQDRDLNEVLGEAEQKIFALAQEQYASNSSLKHNSEVATEAYNYLSENNAPIYPTGLYDLDALIGGFEPGTLTVLAGRPSLGKSQTSLFLTHQMMSQHNLPVVFFSLEMSRLQIEFRLWSLISSHPAYSQYGFKPLEGDRVRKHRSGIQPLQQWEWDMLSQITGIAIDLPLIINDSRSPTLFEIQSQVRQVIAQHGQVGLVVVDYLQMMSGDDENDNRSYELGKLVRGLYTMAGDLNVPVLALSQVSRAVESRNNKRPGMSDLAQSGIIEAVADTVIGLYRDEYYNPDTPDRGILEMIALKNRHGAVGTARTLLDRTSGMILNLTKSRGNDE